jgi:hypothetical protein
MDPTVDVAGERLVEIQSERAEGLLRRDSVMRASLSCSI